MDLAMATMIVNKLNCQLNMGLPSPVNKKGEKERDSYLPRDEQCQWTYGENHFGLISREKCWHRIPNSVHGISSSFSPFPYTSSALFVSSRLHFANLIKHGAYGRKNFRISPSWAIYHVEHMVNVSLQTPLCRVPSCEENLVEDRITWNSGAKCEDLLTLPELSDPSSSMAIKLLWGKHRMLWRTLASTLEASKLDGPNYECRGSSFDLPKQALLLTFSKYAAAAFLTRLTRRGKRIDASEGMNGFESAVVSMSDFMALRSVW